MVIDRNLGLHKETKTIQNGKNLSKYERYFSIFFIVLKDN